MSDNFFENRLFTSSANELDSGLPVSPSASRSCSSSFSNSASNPGIDSVLFHQPSVLCLTHTPSIAFRHLPPNSARFSYATEVALFISAQLSMQRRGQRPPKGSGTNMTVEATKRQSKHVNMRRIPSTPGKKIKEIRLDSNDCGFICAGVNFVGGYK